MKKEIIENELKKKKKKKNLCGCQFWPVQPPRGRHSTRGVGIHMPDPQGEAVTPDGVKVPCGKVVPNDSVGDEGSELQYNEYIVYDTSQVLHGMLNPKP